MLGRANKSSKYKGKHRSIVRQQLRVTGFYTFLIVALCLFIGVWLFLSSTMDGILQQNSILAQVGVAEIYGETDPVACSKQVLEIAQTNRRNAGDDAYYSKFEAVTKNQGYDEMTETLSALESETYWCFLAVYDETTDELIVVADADNSADPKEMDLVQPGKTLDIPTLSTQQFFEASDGVTANTYYFLPEVGLLGASAAYLVDDDPSSGMLFVVSPKNDVLDAIQKIIIRYIEVLFIMFGVSAYYITRRMESTIVQPISEIEDAALSFSKDRAAGTVGRRYFSKLKIHTGNEVDHLGSVLADMEDELATYITDIAQMSAEKEREETELRTAAQIQRSALPDTFPAFPNRSEFDIYASMDPAREVGGDFYDFFLVDDDHLCMVIADVSDKGVPAALFMMTSKTTLSNNIMMGKSPAEALRDTNVSLYQNNRTGMFVTIWVGILEISTGVLVAANGGHEYPVLQRPHGPYALYKDRHGLVIGARRNSKYTDYKIVLRPGSKLFVYTDGVTEAMNTDDQLFGKDRMVDTLNEVKEATPQEVLRHMHHTVDEYAQGTDQSDDITMLCLEYKGADGGDNEC